MKILQQILSLFSLVILTTSQILAIDFGTEFVKAAVVNKGSGKAFSIVETPRSERKFINSVHFTLILDWFLLLRKILLILISS